MDCVPLQKKKKLGQDAVQCLVVKPNMAEARVIIIRNSDWEHDLLLKNDLEYV